MPQLNNLWSMLLLAGIIIGPLPLTLRYASLALRQNRPTHLPELTLTLVVTWAAIQMAIALFLGLIGRLSLAWVLGFEAAIFVAGLGSLARRRRERRPIRPLASLNDAPAIFRRTDLTSLAILGTILFLGLLLLGNVASQPITDYDSIFYHLPFVANVHSTAHLSIIGQSEGVQSYPYGWEALAVLAVLPFAADFLAATPNLIAWALFGLGMYLLARQFDAHRPIALSAALLLLSLPVVVDQINSMRVDLALAAFFLAGLFFAQRFGRTGLAGYASLGLICVGLLFGVKTSGIIYGGLLLTIGAFLRIWQRMRSSDRRGDSAAAGRAGTILLWLVGLASLLFLGSFWYLRNLNTFGNPLGDVAVQVGNRIVFDGAVLPKVLRATTLAIMFETANLDHWAMLAEQLGSRLSAPLLVLLVMVLAAPIGMLATRMRGKPATHPTPRGRRAGILFLMALLALIYWVTPFSGDDGTNEWVLAGYWLGQGFRFALPLIGLFAVLAGVSATDANVRAEWLAVAAIFASLATFAGRSWLYGIAVSIYASFLLAFSLTLRQDRYTAILRSLAGWLVQRRIVVALLLATLGIVTIAGLRQIRDQRRIEVYGALPAVIEDQTRAGEVIGYTLSHQSYLLYGERLDRQVVYLPAELEDSTTLRAILDEHSIKYVATGPLYPPMRSFPIVGWLTDPAGAFEQIFSDGAERPVLYRLKE